MSREWLELEKLYARLMTLSPEEREQELARLPIELGEAIRARMDAMLSQASLEVLEAEEQHESGRQVGPYVLRECLGEGGMGTVYLASRGAGAANLALKLTQRDAAQDLARFEREARTLKELRHPNICTAIDHGLHEGMPYLVMELVTGKDLKECVQDLPASPDPAWCAEVILQAAEGLAAVHAQQVVHRDIKPRNVMVEERGGRVWVKIVDFGICRWMGGGEGFATRGNPGTLHFASPEQLRGSDEVGAPSDIYSLGLTAVYLLTGGSVIATDRSRAIKRGAVESLSCVGIADGELLDCIVRMLHDLPDQRPTAEQVVSEMRRFLSRQESSRAIESGKATAPFSSPFPRTSSAGPVVGRAAFGEGADTSKPIDSTDPFPDMVALGRVRRDESLSRGGAEAETMHGEYRASHVKPSETTRGTWQRKRLEFRWIILSSILILIVAGLWGLLKSGGWSAPSWLMATSRSRVGPQPEVEVSGELPRTQTPWRSGYRPLFDYQPILDDLMAIQESDRPHMVYLAIPSALIPSVQQAGITSDELRMAAAAALATLDADRTEKPVSITQIEPLGKPAIYRVDLRDVFTEARDQEVRPDLLWSSELSDNPFALLPSDKTADDSWLRLHQTTAITSPVVRLDWLAYRAWKQSQAWGQSDELSSSLSRLATWYDSLVLDAATVSKLFDLPIEQLRQIEVVDRSDLGWNWDDAGPNRVWETEVRGGESLFQFFSRSAGLGVPVLMH